MNLDKLVRDFHAKFNFPMGRDLREMNAPGVVAGDVATCMLMMLSEQLHSIAEHIEGGSVSGGNSFWDGNHTDPRLFRAHLIIEEVAELLEGMSRRDRVMTLDALADLTYVVVGTGVTFSLPVHAAVIEVHRSNMTKSVEHGREGHPKKGPGYKQPDLIDLVHGSSTQDAELLAGIELKLEHSSARWCIPAFDRTQPPIQIFDGLDPLGDRVVKVLS